MNKKIFSILLITIGFIYSCSTDFDVDADWKDITIVYGLLNPADSVQYIKVNKAFLGKADAYQMAQCSDSLNYSNVNVILEKIKKGKVVTTITLEKTILPKVDGIFSTNDNIVYKTNARLLSTSDDIEDIEYALRIFIPQNGKNIESKTSLVDNLRISSLQKYISFTHSENEPNCVVKFETAKNAKLYELSLSIHFIEYNSETGSKTYRTLDWPQPLLTSETNSGMEKLEFDINKQSFFRFMASKLTVSPSIKRVAIKRAVDLNFIVGGEDLNTYIEVNSPSNTIVQEKPAYTNITNGIGLFSCRYDTTVAGKQFSDDTLDSLSLGPITRELNFVPSYSTDYVNIPDTLSF